ncbi:MAG: glycosyltransferase [Ruminococcaceae bacterium]|nr:glycosyltransferase [Oscillospiraceae bacterium]
MKHIVQVLTDTNIGGAGRYLLNYVKHFDRSAFRVTVILPQGSQLIERIQGFEGVTLLEAPYMADCSYDKRCVKHLRALFGKIKPDVLHTHACLSARIAGKQAKVPVVLATRHCIEPLPRGIKALASGFINNALCDYYIAVADAVVDNLIACGIKPEKIKTVNNGVEPIRLLSNEEKAAARTRLSIKPEETVFGIFGRLEPVKGHKYFIKAARQVIREGASAKFLIVGSGSLEKELKERVTRYGLDDYVLFTGFVADTTELLNLTDIHVNASESEAMSLSVLEAMSLEKPSIATKNGGNSELIRDGEDGLLVGYADSASLANAMLRLLENPDVSARFGKKAGEKFRAHYTVEEMVNHLEKLYREVMQK